MDYREKEEHFLIRDLKERFLWSIWLRYVVVAVGVYFCLFYFFGEPVFPPLLWLLFALLAYNFLGHLLVKIKTKYSLKEITLAINSFNLLDIVAITYLVYLSGSVDSPYWFLYLVLILVSGFGLFSSHTLIVFFISIFSMLFYVGLLLLSSLGVLPVYDQGLRLTPLEILNLIVTKAIFVVLTFLLFAVVVFYFSRLLSQHRQELAKKKEQLLVALLKMKDTNHLKDEFIANASHELRTPLSVVRENIALIGDGVVGPVNEKQKELIVSSLESIDGLAKILNNLLDISKIESHSLPLHQQKANLADLVKRAIDILKIKAENRRVTIENLLPPEVVVWADPDQILRVLINFIDNAIKYSAEGENITIGIEDLPKFVRLYVEDQGLGIEKKDLPHVFERFTRFREEIKGTGLGLSICKAIIDMHLGTVGVKSRAGEGSKFFFTLPKVDWK